ncbi:MAG: integrase [bacterium]|nr:MAG: integrase [bacterium]
MLCQYFNKSRQAYYRSVRAQEETNIKEATGIQLIQDIRKVLPRVGCRKLYHMLRKDFERLGLKLGRDKLFDLLRRKSLLIPRKRSYTKTTNSNHWYNRYKNQIKDLEITYPNQVFASDITYIRVQGSFMYLSLVTDMCSRKIVGYCLSESLSAKGPLSALKMAMRGVHEPDKLTHHSDRGIQYCCDDYTSYLKAKKVLISMTEEDHVYENALAERVNGILKDEFLLDERFSSEDLAQRAVREAVRYYNELRPHMSLNYETPDQRYAA